MKPDSTVSRMRQRWVDCRPTKAHAFWIAGGCVVATLIAGFGFGGWVTGGTAEKRAAQAAAESRHQLAAAVCVEDFMRTASAGAQFAKLKEAGWYERKELVSVGGWATMPDRKEPNSEVAYLCAEKLSGMQMPAAAKATPASATVLAN